MEGAAYLSGCGSRWRGFDRAGCAALVALELWQVNPRLGLTWYLQSCAEAGSQVPNDIERLLPWNLSEDMRAKLRLGMPTPQPDSS